MNMFEGQVIGPGRVRIGAAELACEGLGERPPGQRVRLGLRPEEVRVRGVEPGSPNAIAVTVELLDFLGPFCRATLHAAGADQLVISADFSTNAVRDLGIAEGGTLTVVLPPQSLQVFDGDDAGLA
jgi:iron(III) transport system ATP-binding protein